MESLESFKEYIGRFQQLHFSDFADIYGLLYPDCKELQDRIEFSLLVNRTNDFDLRFGLFRLYDTRKISSLFKKMGHGGSDIERILLSTKNFVPEFAVGFDFNKENPRIKVYFLRLPDNAEFNRDPFKRINSLSDLIGIDCSSIDQREMIGCYLMAVDFYRTNRPTLKIYTREKSVDFSKTEERLRSIGIDSQHLRIFQELFPNGELKDTTISRKHPANQNGQNSISVFFEADGNINGAVDQLVKRCAPQRFVEFRDTIKTLGRDEQVRYSHVGLTFSEEHADESICLYFTSGTGGH